MTHSVAATQGAHRRLVVSMVIATLIALQAWQTIPIARWLIGPQESGWRGALLWRARAPWLYPFIDYPMYSQARARGEATLEPRVSATLINGTDLAISPADLGMSYFMFNEQLVGSIAKSDRARLRRLVKPIEDREHQKVSIVRLELEAMRWGEHGIERGERVPQGSVVLSDSLESSARPRP
jgi:hypothetical protein